MPGSGPALTEVLRVSSSSSTSPDAIQLAKTILGCMADINVRFSENRCAKALPLAMAVYKEGNPPHYLEEFHNSKVKIRK